MPRKMTFKAIVYRGASVEQGQSMLRLFDREDLSWYFALIDADGGWYSLNIPSNTDPMVGHGA